MRFTNKILRREFRESQSNEVSNENASTPVSSQLQTAGINYSEYTDLLMGYDLVKLLNETPNGNKRSIVLSVLSKTNNTWRVSNGGQYADFNIPARLSSVYNENEIYYLFLVEVSGKSNSSTITVVEVLPFTTMGIPNERDGKVLKLRTPRDFNLESFIQEYLKNKNNPAWVNPIKQVPDVSTTKYGKYLRWLGGSSLARAENEATGYFICEGINQSQVRSAENDGSGWFPLRLGIDTFYFNENDRATLLQREYAEGNDGLLLLLKKNKGSGNRSDRAEVEWIILLKNVGIQWDNPDVDRERIVAEYFLKNN